MKVLVTGAEGFIGSHIVEELVRRGNEVRALVLYNSFDSRGWLETVSPEIMDSVQVEFGDVRDRSQLRSLMMGTEVVIHLAALIGIPYSYRAPESYLQTNVLGTLNVLENARELGGIQVVQTSTSEVYGTAKYVPIDELHPLAGQSPYAASKIAADQFAFSFWASFGLPVTVVRPFNTYGPRQSTRAVVPAIITQLLSGSRLLSLGDVSPTRDFSFVSDTAAAFVAAAGNEGTFGEVINLGSGFEISILETAELIGRLVGQDFEVEEDLSRRRPPESEVRRLFSNPQKSRELLKLKGEYEGIAGFERGLVETIDWFSNPGNMSRYHLGQYTV